ncbi:hypothetical protein TL16_g06438 [Triparma laevis f. inornata]|uniref:Uncharacterized protein n=2 Tax=Triparma laevis TaxID=1534972 RepID=A0A9W7F301_9STRA|nr:hypothetical protein TL16_g06438 [Triparma laevis f. inornata]GMI00251.1 hypothetical protein TrLO_g11329 [Triparma laevis f. longispina]
MNFPFPLLLLLLVVASPTITLSLIQYAHTQSQLYHAITANFNEKLKYYGPWVGFETLIVDRGVYDSPDDSLNQNSLTKYWVLQQGGTMVCEGRQDSDNFVGKISYFNIYDTYLTHANVNNLYACHLSNTDNTESDAKYGCKHKPTHSGNDDNTNGEPYKQHDHDQADLEKLITAGIGIGILVLIMGTSLCLLRWAKKRCCDKDEENTNAQRPPRQQAPVRAQATASQNRHQYNLRQPQSQPQAQFVEMAPPRYSEAMTGNQTEVAFAQAVVVSGRRHNFDGVVTAHAV